MTPEYDPFATGRFAVGVRAFHLADTGRGRRFPGALWYPARDRTDDGPERRDAAAQPGRHPLIVFSHHAGGHRRSSSFLCRHLASHGYVVAAIDHSETAAPELAGNDRETEAARRTRVAEIIASRVPDVRLLLDHVLSGRAEIRVDPDRVGLVGHSLGGWTVLATPEVDPRVGSVVAIAPGGGDRPRPGVLSLPLGFARQRAVPTLFLAAELDVPIPVDSVRELFDRTPDATLMCVLAAADHQHFVDDVVAEHEAFRTASLPRDAAWMTDTMRPIGELCPPEQAHLFTRGLTLAHLDSSLRNDAAAGHLLDGDLGATLASRGVTAAVTRAAGGLGARG